MGLSPRKVNEYLKGELRNRGIQVPKNTDPEVKPTVDTHKTPTDRLVARLGLSQYYGKHARSCVELLPDEVFIPFQQHIGKPAVAVKGIGSTVEKGELIAKADEGLSVNIHASVAGTVTDITPKGMMIRRRKE